MKADYSHIYILEKKKCTKMFALYQELELLTDFPINLHTVIQFIYIYI